MYKTATPDVARHFPAGIVLILLPQGARRNMPAKSVPASSPSPSPSPAIPIKVRHALIDRLESAWATGALPPDVSLYAAILTAILPEDFPAIGALKTPVAPTTTPPMSTDRAKVYAARRARGEALYHPDDAKPAAGDGAAEMDVSILGRINIWSKQVVGGSVEWAMPTAGRN